MFPVEQLILVAGILLLIGILSSKISARVGVPVLVLFLLLGMVAGPEGVGRLDFVSYEIAYGIGTLALALILFDGGLSTQFSDVRAVWKPSMLLATVGVLATALVTGLAAYWVLDITLLQGMLLGSIVGSTDAAAVFSILRNGGTGLPKRLQATLEVESGSNDPMAIFLTIGFMELISQPTADWTSLVMLFLSQMVLGGILGLGMGFAGAQLVNRIELGTSGLYPVLTITICLLTFGLTAQIGGSGFLAVYLAGVTMGNSRLVYRSGILGYHDAAAWLSQITMFVVLGLLCSPSQLLAVSGKALLICLVLVFIARPIAVLATLVPFFRMRWQELTLLSWVGLKGAVPITLATFPLMQGTPQAPLMFNVVFFIVVVSALVQGSTLPMVARWLGLGTPIVPTPAATLEISSLRHVDGEVVDYSVDSASRAAGRKVRELALPDGVVIAMVVRDDQIIPPQGRTEIRAGDHVIVVLRPGSRPLVDQVFGGHEEGFGELPMSIEFPLRGSTTIGEMQEFYGLQLDVPADTTLDEVLRRRVDRNRPATNQAMRFGPLVLRIRSINSDGEIERVGMTILPENEIANYERKVNLDGAPTDKPPSADALPANPIVAPPKVS